MTQQAFQQDEDKRPDVLPTESPEEARPLPKHKLHIVAEPSDLLS